MFMRQQYLVLLWWCQKWWNWRPSHPKTTVFVISRCPFLSYLIFFSLILLDTKCSV